ncbi:MAG: FecR domain-containing protein [Odoribacteraceae bacterium]|jgi:ferric-dicitrate binding protein FerR (iron transport regulator)|nr:FecR domain-containing protein [Odoribacteraceae bacterium]
MRDLDDMIADRLAGEPLDDEEKNILAREREALRLVACRQWLRRGAPARERYLRERDALFQELRVAARRRTRIRRTARGGVAAAVAALIAWGTMTFVDPRDNEPTGPLVARVEIAPGAPRAELRLGNGKRALLAPGVATTIRSDSLLEIKSEENILTYSGRGSGGTPSRDTLVVPPGGEYTLVLPDGTRIHLNSATELSFPSPFTGEQREVLLHGEAYFEVNADASRPFIVRTGEVTVEVTGTSFNVNAYATRQVVATTLETGRLRVTRGERSREARPGEQVIYDKESQQLKTRAVETGLYTSWKDGYYIFREMPLEEIMTTLASWYNVNILYMDERVKTTRFTGRLQRFEGLLYLLKKFEETGSILASVDGNTIILDRK